MRIQCEEAVRTEHLSILVPFSRTVWWTCEDSVRNMWGQRWNYWSWSQCEEPVTSHIPHTLLTLPSHVPSQEEHVRTVWGVREEPGSSQCPHMSPLNGNMWGHCDSVRDIVWNLWGTCEEYIWGCSVRNTWDPSILVRLSRTVWKTCEDITFLIGSSCTPYMLEKHD